MALRGLAALAILVLSTPGCITAGLWEWEGETAPRWEAPVGVDGTTRPLDDEDLATTVRYGDGAREVVRWSLDVVTARVQLVVLLVVLDTLEDLFGD